MSTNLEWNKKVWSDKAKWDKEWNSGYSWGLYQNVETDFMRFVAPYIGHIDSPSILEIACGMGRFTEFLLKIAGKLHSIDIQSICVEACRKRFKDVPNFSASVTDGKTLPDGSYDIIASYDSLVHADFDVLSSYFKQASGYLNDKGILIIHHANRPDLNNSRFPVTSEMIKEYIESDIPHLQILSQTLFRYEKPRFVDCVTVCKKNNELNDLGYKISKKTFFGELITFKEKSTNQWCSITDPGNEAFLMHPNAPGEPDPEYIFSHVNLAGKRSLQFDALVFDEHQNNPGAKISVALYKDQSKLIEEKMVLSPCSVRDICIRLPKEIGICDIRISVGLCENSLSNMYSQTRIGPLRID